MRRLSSGIGGAVASLVLLLAGCATGLLTGCAGGPSGQDTLTLRPVPFSDLPGWDQDKPSLAMIGFIRDCAMFDQLSPTESLGGSGLAAERAGTPDRWRRVCADARALPIGDDGAVRAFFERDFQAYAIGHGLVTGYYEPEVQGSRTRGGAYQVPILARPDDLVSRDAAAGKDSPDEPAIGRLVDGRLVPYYDRKQIESGVLIPQHLELLWLTSWVDAYFLEVQGAGRVRLPDGGVVRVGFAGKNGLGYVAIGRVLEDRGDLPRGQSTAQSIRAWLEAHPDQARAVMDQNPSYVFFRILPRLPQAEGPPGVLGTALVPGRSVAVDRSQIPLGTPDYLATTDPLTNRPLDRLMIAQDIGGAIRGPNRADIFFGWGPEAEAAAGGMRADASEFILLPRPDSP